MYKLLLFFILSLPGITVKAQKLNAIVTYVVNDKLGQDSINYTYDNQLTWNDFKAKPVEQIEAAAITNAGFGVKLTFRRKGNNTELFINVNCSFSKNDSWVKKGNKTPYILNHEQKHFDIAFINTVQFIQRLRKAKFTVDNYADVIQNLYKQTTEQLTKYQDQYDTETDHSRLPLKQVEWDEKISEQLELALSME